MSFSELLTEVIDSRLADVQTGIVATIESFDKEKMRAEVQPLQKRKSGESEVSFPRLKNLPVQFLFAGGFYIRPDYQKGDLVWIYFATQDIEAGLRGRSELVSGKIFSPENACVSHGLAKTGFIAPHSFSEDGLLIGNDNYVFKFEESKVTIDFGSTQIEFSATGMKVVTGASSFDFLTHIHTTGVGPSGPPQPGA